MPTGLQFVGSSSLVFGPTEVHYGPKGNTTHFTVTCPLLAPLIAYYNYVITFGASGVFSGLDYGEDRRLEVSVPGLTSISAGIINELFFDQWDLVTNENSDTIFANPLLVGGATPLMNYNAKSILSFCSQYGVKPAGAVDQLNAMIGKGIVGPTPAQGGDSSSKFTTTTLNATHQQLYLEILKTQVEYEKPSYVLRHSSYCSAGATYNAAISGAQKIYSTAQLLTEVGSGWTYNLPARLYSKINSIPVEFAPAEEAPYYTWGWLKKITREPVLANFMVEISTEYELTLWSNLRYALL